MMRLARATLWMALIAVGVFTMGCTDDLYGACEIRPESGDVLEDCLGEGGSQQLSCVVREQGQCQTGACGRYRGSAPFCTTTCTSDDDCPSGECREFVYQSGERYCVALEDL